MPSAPARIFRTVGIAVAVLGVALLATLAVPVRSWRTGEQPAPPLALVPRASIPGPPRRVWIDTDAACGQGRRKDPDDCLAILLLALTPGVEVVGISTVFGNAPLGVTDSVTRALATVSWATGREVPPVHRGAAEPLRPDGSTPPAPAHRALRAALEQGPLTLVALGPLTNVAAALSGRPDLQARVGRLVAVMGRRPGHLFHPAEGVGGGILFGHGPVFRDFNLVMDSEAAARVVAMQLATTLVPYEAARDIEITGADRLVLTAGAWRSPQQLIMRAGRLRPLSL